MNNNYDPMCVTKQNDSKKVSFQLLCKLLQSVRWTNWQMNGRMDNAMLL